MKSNARTTKGWTHVTLKKFSLNIVKSKAKENKHRFRYSVYTENKKL